MSQGRSIVNDSIVQVAAGLPTAARRKIGASDELLDQLTLELQPAYTKADEQKDLATLSIPDIVSLESDLHGITNGISGLSVTGGSSWVQHSLAIPTAADTARLDDEMTKLPPSQTAAYRQALVKCPELVTFDRKIAFLECEGNDAALAATRLARHWEVRLELFGPNRCFLPMTLAGAMQDEASIMIDQQIQRPLPVRDTAGRVVIFIDPSRRNFEEYSMEQELMVVWYLLETAAEDEEARRRGAVFVSDGRNMQRKHYSSKFKLWGTVMFHVLPIRTRAFHLCFPSKILNYVIEPVVRRFISKDIRLHFKKHNGSPDEVLRDLEAYCLPRDRLPTELGGSVVLDMKKFVMDRLALESLRLTLTSSAAQVSDGSTTKRLRSENDKNLSSAPVPLASTTDEKEGRNIGKGRVKGKVRGKKSDPRMSRAIEAKQANPNLSVYDALVVGGFVFRVDSSGNGMVDADGITLKQRRNNLCRRLRIEKQKQAKQGVADSTDVKQGAEEQDEMASPVFEPLKVGEGEAAIAQQSALPLEGNEDGSTTKRLRSENDKNLSSAPVPLASTTDEKGGRNIGKGGIKGKFRGKKSDPRMSRAIEAKQANPNLSVYDALVVGGFVFRVDSSGNGMVDDDGITLKQRRNNLCRRLRREKQKQAKQGVADSTDVKQGAEEQDEMAGPVFEPLKVQTCGEGEAAIAQQSALPLEGNDVTKCPADSSVIHNHNGMNVNNVNGLERRDSFYEDILELPRLDDFDNIDFDCMD